MIRDSHNMVLLILQFFNIEVVPLSIPLSEAKLIHLGLKC